MIYLSHIGVAPERQGEGLGTSLMRDGLASADRDGVATWLETSVPQRGLLRDVRIPYGDGRRRPGVAPHLVHAPRSRLGVRWQVAGEGTQAVADQSEPGLTATVNSDCKRMHAFQLSASGDSYTRHVVPL